MEPSVIGLGVVVLFLAAIAAGFPVFIAMGMAALIGNAAIGGFWHALQNAALRSYQGLDSFVLLAVPLYVLTGTLLQATDLSGRLFRAAAAWTAGLRGGLAVATIVACAIFASISGSSVATAATIGLIAMPALGKRGYPLQFSGALIAAGGTLGILIPPSIAFILFGLLTDQSVGALFMAGVLPGFLLAACMAGWAAFTSDRMLVDTRTTLEERLTATRASAPVLVLPLLIFVGIYAGLATPTEIAGIAVFYTVLVGIMTRTLTLPGLRDATMEAVRTSSMIIMLVAFGFLLTEFYTATRLPQLATDLIAGLGLGKFAVVTLMVVFYLVLGMFLEALSMMLVTVPILYPVAIGVGIDPLVFGVFVVLAMETALITPPVGMNLFTIATIGKVPFGPLSWAALPYVGLMVLGMYVVVFVPSLATLLPATMGVGR